MDWDIYRHLRNAVHSDALRGPSTEVLGRIEDRAALRRDLEARRLVGSDEGEWRELARRRVGGVVAPRGQRRSADLRLLVVDRPALGGCWFGAELTRSFATDYFSITRHKRLFETGERDCVTGSAGALHSDTFHPYQVGPGFAAWRSQLQVDLLTYARAVHAERPIDLALVFGSYLEFEPRTLNVLRDLGIPVALLWLDDVHAFAPKRRPFPNGQTPLIGSVDVHLTSTRRAVAWYLSRGAAATWFPPGVDADVFRPDGGDRPLDVVFVGDAYGPRLKAIEALERAGVHVHCFGKSWPAGPVDDLAEIYADAKLVLGFGYTGRSKTNTCLKGRDFEATACGAAYVTTFNSELTPLFDLGSELACYPSLDELPTIVTAMLADPDGLREMGVRARSRVVAQHTWTHRVADLSRWLGLVADA